MKQLWNENWQAKVICFFGAILLWVLLKETIEPGTLDQLLTGTMPQSSVESVR